MIVFVGKKVLEEPIGNADNFGPLKRKNIMMTCSIRSILSYAGEETGPCFPRAARPPPGLPLRDSFHFENFQSQVIHVSQGNAATVLRSQLKSGSWRSSEGRRWLYPMRSADTVLAADPGKEVRKQVMQNDVLKEVVMNRGPRLVPIQHGPLPRLASYHHSAWQQCDHLHPMGSTVCAATARAAMSHSTCWPS